ncbi:MAG: beta-galactosidase trimerization domain-containing protein, partial [Clostridia bacterium]|nr:beta-galactosidase trimerization domain-containing protein [Clostridia bacterium]
DAKVLRDVGVYINFDSFADADDEGKPSSTLKTYAVCMDEKLKNLNKAFSRAHMDYDILTKKNIHELSRYKVLIIPDLYRMSESECAALRQYVKDGGRIYISGCSSALSADGKNTDRFMLEDVLGVAYTGYSDRSPVYMAPTAKGQKYFGNFNETYPAMFMDAAVTTKLASDTAQVWATVTYPLTDKNNIRHYSSAISNPPAEKTDMPALVYHPFGAGASLYSFAPFEKSVEAANYDVFAELIYALLDEQGGAILTTNESEYLEHVVRHNEEKKHYTVSLLNYQNVKKIVPLYDVTFCLNLDITPKKVYTTLSTEVKTEKQNGKLFVQLAKLNIYDVIYIEY